jgi:uncharacterized protein (DUF58 family)
MSDTAKYFRPEVLSRITRLELRARHVVEGFVSGMHRSPYKGFSVEFANHRPYVPGDDVRHIDWRVYAKTDRFFIKEYEEETNLRTHLLVDCSESMAYPEHGGDGRMTKWAYATTAAACLAYLLHRQQDGVGLVLFDDEVRAQLPVSASRAALLDLTSALERTDPKGRTDVKRVFAPLAARWPRRGMVVILSDLLVNLDDLLEMFHRFRYGAHDVLVLHVMDADELEFPFTDRTLFEGMEQTDLEVLTDPQALRGSYLAALGEFLQKVRAACLNHGIDYSLLSTADGLDVTLTRFLAARMRLQRAKA